MTSLIVISRTDAKAHGLRRFFTGVLCRNMHLSERAVSNAQCVACRDIGSEKYRADGIVNIKNTDVLSMMGKEINGIPVISRIEARKQNLDYFFSGIPCHRGHNEKRLVSNGSCRSCRANAKKEFRLRNLDEAKAYSKAAYEKDPVKFRAKARLYRLNNPDRVIESRKKYIVENKEKLRLTWASYRLNNKYKVAAAQKKYRDSNKNKISERFKLYSLKNREEIAKCRLAYRLKNVEKIASYKKIYEAKNKVAMYNARKKWRSENRAICNALKSMYRARLMRATPKWANLKEIKAIYVEATKQSKHVDHIFPLQGEIYGICGLHVTANLQLLTPLENFRKRNKFNHAEHEWSIK